MAKMFYTLEEAAQKLGMDVDDVKGLTESGQLQEFRDQDQIMLKVEQVDLLAGDNDDSGGMIPLADSGEIEPITMSSSGSGFNLDADPDQTGVSIFDPEDEDDADPAAATQVSPSMVGFADFGDAGASGSGLANLALEGDDTSLGADLLDDVYSNTGSGSVASSGVGGSGIADAEGDLFESAGTQPESIAAAAPGMAGIGAMMPESYDGAGSGLVGGVAIGIVVTVLLSAVVMILMLDGNAQLMEKMSMNLVYGAIGVGAGVMIFGGLIGWFLLRKT
jgi:hypothetical protein